METKKYERDVTFTSGNLTLWEGLLLKSVVDAISKGKIIVVVVVHTTTDHLTRTHTCNGPEYRVSNIETVFKQSFVAV